jgi:hypothetical protein
MHIINGTLSRSAFEGHERLCHTSKNFNILGICNVSLLVPFHNTTGSGTRAKTAILTDLYHQLLSGGAFPYLSPI